MAGDGTTGCWALRGPHVVTSMGWNSTTEMNNTLYVNELN